MDYFSTFLNFSWKQSDLSFALTGFFPTKKRQKPCVLSGSLAPVANAHAWRPVWQVRTKSKGATQAGDLKVDNQWMIIFSRGTHIWAILSLRKVKRPSSILLYVTGHSCIRIRKESDWTLKHSHVSLPKGTAERHLWMNVDFPWFSDIVTI